ncbi:hypothetical protein IMY05_C4445000400 [Salix suchowensis]|nr:hypothetical protein IMY05_C4445000400 [Salix suchowensis]
MLGHLIEQVDVAKAALQAATIDVSEREASYRTFLRRLTLNTQEIEALKDKLSCLDGGDVQRFEEMAATISDLQGPMPIYKAMHTGVCVDSQRISNAHEDLKDRFATVTANHEELQRTCHVLENLRDHLAEPCLRTYAMRQLCRSMGRNRRKLSFLSCPMEPRVIVGLKDVVEKVVAVQVPGSSRVNPIEIV